MDDSTLQNIIINEKEWRTHLIKEIETIKISMETTEDHGIKNSLDIVRLKTWNIVWRFLGTSVFAFLIYAFKDKLF